MKIDDEYINLLTALINLATVTLVYKTQKNVSKKKRSRRKKHKK